jgi:Reverse transcriptase (RNA-dependent DNA polymerase)
MTNSDYLQRFTNLADIAMSYNGQLHDQAIVDIVTKRAFPRVLYANLNADNKALMQTAAHELYVATMFIQQSDRRRYGKLTEELENGFAKGNDDYPSDLVKAYYLINEYKNWNSRVVTPESSGVAFAQKGKNNKSDKDDTSWHKDAICHKCNEKGHIRPNCPKLDQDDDADDDDDSKKVKSTKNAASTKPTKKTFVQHDANDADEDDDQDRSETGNQFLNFGFCTPTADHDKNLDLRKLILLDNQSTVDLFCNSSLVTKVWNTKDSMTVQGNGGSLTTKSKAFLRGYGEVWFHADAITNILSLKNVREKNFRVTYDTDGPSCFLIHKPDGEQIRFEMHVDGLHYHDTLNRQLTLVNTVREQSEGYSAQQISKAKAAREFQTNVGHPSTSDLKAIIKSNQIANCPVTTQDIDRAEEIFGPSVPILKGKTTRSAPTSVVSDYVAVPMQILKANRHISLAADIFFINTIPFFATISEHIKFTTTEHIQSRKLQQLVQAFRNTKAIYTARGFNVHTALMDGEFAPLRHYLAEHQVQLNLTSANEHVPRIERQIRVIKERVRATRHTLPFKVIPLLMLVDLVYTTTLWINAFPPKGGVSTNLSPRSIMTGIQFDFKKHCQLQFGSYVQAHEEPSPTNTQAARTVGAICLGPTGNLQGSYKFLNLRTGKRITRRSWTHLPMPQEVIDRVNELGKAQGQPELLSFFDRKGRMIGDVAELHPDPGVPDQDNPDEPEMLDPPPNDDLQDLDLEPFNQDFGMDEEDEEPPDDPQHEAPPELELQPDLEPPPEPDQEYPIPDDEPQAPSDEGTWVRRSTRTQNQPTAYAPSFEGKSYSAVTLVHPDAHMNPDYTLVAHHIMTQLSMKAGMKRWKNKAEGAVTKELQQLHFRDTFEPIDPKTLSKQEYDQALESHLFLKQKRDDTIKGRLVAGGNKQRGTIEKEEATSPTAALESVLLTATIDALEERDVATIDIPNAFVQTRLENDADKAIMRMRGRLAELMVKVAPEIYSKYVIVNSNGQTVLYVRLLNALYGIIKAALLYYQRFVRDLQSIGFQLNPYDPCVANKIVDGLQLTVVWHVDDLKVSHKHASVVTKMATWLKATYERLFTDGSGAMTLHRGKVHEYLGMTLDYSVKGKVKVTMIPYIKEIIDQFAPHDDDPTKTALTPAADHLFVIDPKATPLSEDMAPVFHHFVAKSLFATKRARPDISTAVAFLTTRVRAPDQDDWKKLIRLVRYLRGTSDLPLTLEADATSIIKWWVDGSHTTHADMRGHSGGCLSLGRGMPVTGSSKQKLNTRSSTESELVAADDYMPNILWTNHFLDAQGYASAGTILYQDNQSAILLERNGRKSSSRRTKHLNVRYYFISDRIHNKDLTVEYCPTEEMVADYFTKPLQGKLFLKFRSTIMNLK